MKVILLKVNRFFSLNEVNPVDSFQPNNSMQRTALRAAADAGR